MRLDGERAFGNLSTFAPRPPSPFSLFSIFCQRPKFGRRKSDCLWRRVNRWVGTTSVTPLVSGKIITLSSWRTGFYGLLGLTGLCLIFVWFGMPESTFSRDPTSSAGIVKGGVDEGEDEGRRPKDVSLVDEETQRDFELVRGRRNVDLSSSKMTMARPFAIMFTPNVFWGCITYAWLFTNQVLFGSSILLPLSF